MAHIVDCSAKWLFMQILPRLCPPHLSVCVREAVRSSIDLLIMTREKHGRRISTASMQRCQIIQKQTHAAHVHLHTTVNQLTGLFSNG